MAYTYILRCSDGTLYTGWTSDIDKRLLAHNAGKGAKYTRGRLPVQLVYWEESPSRSDAQIRERSIQKLNKSQKEKLIESFPIT